MRMMGLQPWLGLLQWTLYTITVYVPVTLIVVAVLVFDTGSGAAIDTNFFPLWIMFMLFTMALIAFIFALSSFFNNGE